MKQVKVTDFRAHLPAYLRRVQRGESIVVMSRGKPVARLVPVSGSTESAREQLIALRKHARVGDVVRPIDAEWNAAADSA
jgi:prevent-host-death family protein